MWTVYFITSSISHFQHSETPCLQFDFHDPCSMLVSSVAAVFGIAYFLCRFKDIVVASYFVTAIGCTLELTALGLRNREMAYLVQFALYSASLGFHIENANLCRQSLH